MSDLPIKDSGDRREFSTGAVRDVNEDKGRFDLICPFALRVLAKVLQKGAKKYAERNWEKGIPQSSYIDSAIRHLNNHRIGMRDEDHLAAALYNVHCLVSQRERIAEGLLPAELDDLPNYLEQKKTEAPVDHHASCTKYMRKHTNAPCLNDKRKFFCGTPECHENLRRVSR